MAKEQHFAPGWPGTPARWTSSNKSGVGTALDSASRVWFALGYGILDEVYYPRIDQACIRDLGLIVTDGVAFFSEEKRDTRHEVFLPEPGVPLYRLVNTCSEGRYRIEKWVLADPKRAVILQQVRFDAIYGEADYRVFTLLAPHLGNQGAGNTAWVGHYKGTPMLFAAGHGSALALAASVPWRARSAGFVGVSDGWQDLSRHCQLTRFFDRAENGNVALTGALDWQQGQGGFLLALGFGRTVEEAGHRAMTSLLNGFDAAREGYVGEWRVWQQSLASLDTATLKHDQTNLYRTSTMVMRTHESRSFPGGLIASLSIPWGASKGDDDLGGYHLVWPRDLVETAGGLLAAGAHDTVRRVLYYLQVTQEADGHWLQNMWLDGSPYWNGVQMDETAFPILLVDLAHREGALKRNDLLRLWSMVEKAAAYLVQNGPVTGQDRWEEDAGYSPFTLAVEIAALLAAADLADTFERTTEAAYLRETADCWNSQIEAWTYAKGTDLAHALGIEGYYVRIAPPETAETASPLGGFVPIKNRPPGQSSEPAAFIISPDALALVRFGLRAPDDPRIRNTVKAIDALLKVETPHGPCWHRYNGDGYGEHEDGSPFDGVGVGRAWPLLTAERAHYELAAGNTAGTQELLRAMEAFANDGGLLPEQIWDAPDLSARGLFFGHPTGSAMPLVWAHAEYTKLLRSLRDGRVFDLPPQTFQRYVRNKQETPFMLWRFNHKFRTLPVGKKLRVETLAPSRLHWSTDSWASTQDQETRDTGLGVHVTDVDTVTLKPGTKVSFTFYWINTQQWEGVNYEIIMV